ncbi:MAG: hypothetical protein ACP5J5_05585 [Dissulfurimicrobium sp.]|uniref:hypothetical protein n=1 Tax=Dissulfurimicrobium hydrothermale TaxID=1750598 RepID=UPI003C7819BE
MERFRARFKDLDAQLIDSLLTDMASRHAKQTPPCPPLIEGGNQKKACLVWWDLNHGWATTPGP